MGDKPADGEKSQPSLELPALFRRRNRDRPRRRPAREADPVPAEAPQATTDEAGAPPPVEAPAAVESAPVAQEAPALEREPEPAFEREPAPVSDQEPEPAPEAEAEPAFEPEAEPAFEPEPVLVDAAAPASEPGRRSARARRAERRARRRRVLPRVPPTVAAVATGVLVGLLGAGLTWASLLGCDAVRGTKSCGGGPGLLVLLVILVVMVLVGAGLLRLCRVPEVRSASFLAVGLTAVVVLVTLMQELFSSWMFVAVPLISAGSYGLAHWVTTRYVELPDDGPQHDIR